MKKRISKSLLVLAALTMIGGCVTACDQNNSNDNGQQTISTKYSITFKNFDDSIIESLLLDEGVKVACSKDPTRPDANGYTYIFQGWSTTMNGKVLENLPDVAGDAVYYAVYAAIPLKEEYSIRVVAPTGVTYSLNKERAEEGEEIVLTIDSLNPGLSINEVTFNTRKVEGSGNVFKYTMPAKSIVIKITVSVSGDIVLEGDIAQPLEKDASTGLFVAKDVEVPGNGEAAKFNVVIKSGANNTKLDALALDDTRSFGTVVAGVSKEYVFSVASGAKYDFYYDESDSIAPFYVQRSGVTKLPENSLTLENLLITNKAIRSEYPMHADDMTGVNVTIQDLTSDDVVYEEYDWKLYENNISFATVQDKFDLSADPRYVYKEYDESAKLYTIIDTYAKKSGNVVVNDDPFRLDYNKYGANAGRLSVIEDDDYGSRFAINEKKALRNVRTSAHQPAHLLEMSIYYCYRDSMEVDDSCVYYSLDISSVETGGGNFKTTVTSLREHGQTSSIYSGTTKDATTYKAIFDFNARGEVTAINYSEKYFTEDQWNFVNHEGVIGQKGKSIKTITGEFTYGAPYAGTPKYGDFKKEDYLISSFHDVQFYNKNAKDDEALAAKKSVVGIDNDIYFQSLEGDFNKNLVTEKFYSPATALDIWQYGPTASDHDEIICKEANDSYYQYSAVDLGTANVTFSSHVPGVGASIDVPVEVRALVKARGFWMDNTDRTPGVDSELLYHSEKAMVKAGGTYKFAMRVSADNGIGISESAPLRYTAVSNNEELLTIRSVPNSKYLTIDVSSDAAKAITKSTEVTVTIDSPFYSDYILEKEERKTVFTFTVLPSDIDPIGTWKSTGVAAEDKHFPHTTIVFTNNEYTGEVDSAFEGAKIGYIHDPWYKNGELYSDDYYRFYYTFKSGVLKAKLYKVELEVVGESPTNPNSYELEFNYDPVSENYGVLLYTNDYDSDSEQNYVSVIIGFQDEDIYENIDYAYFEKVVA